MKIKKFEDINLYDLDIVEEYRNYLYDYDINEAYKFNRYFINATYNDQELYEMAHDRSHYKNLCIEMSKPINFTIANIICLEEICPEIVSHWRKELIGFAKNLIIGSYNKSTKKDQLVFILINEYTDEYNYSHRTYTDSIIYEDAMEDEIRKGLNHNATPAQKRIAKYIKTNILPNIEQFVEPNKERVSYLFDKLVESCKYEDINIFKNAVDEFINWEVTYDNERYEDFKL